MEILSFKTRGKFAHFRKYYANNTAFSFSIPPRTTLMGIVAAALGWPRDSYYEKLASDKIRFGVRVLTPLKKSFHRLNFMRIGTSSEDFRGISSRQSEKPQTGAIQTPFELISGLDIARDEVCYQIFLKPEVEGTETFELIKSHLTNSFPVYNITLGTANFTASLYDVELIKSGNIKENKVDDFVLMHSAIPTQLVDDLQFEKEEYGNYNFVEEDMLPGDFVSDMNREVKKMNRLLFSITPNPLRVRLKIAYYELQLKEENINIQFMDL
jgi:CRISPR-associated protein Cas5h